MTHVSGRISLCYCTYFLSVLCVCLVLSCVCFSFYFAFMGYVPELKVIELN